MKSEFGKLLMGIYIINIYLDWSGRTSFGVNLTNALTFCAVGISLTFVEKKTPPYAIKMELNRWTVDFIILRAINEIFVPTIVVKKKTYKRSYVHDIHSCKGKKHSNTVEIILNSRIFAFATYITCICHTYTHNLPTIPCCCFFIYHFKW